MNFKYNFLPYLYSELYFQSESKIICFKLIHQLRYNQKQKNQETKKWGKYNTCHAYNVGLIKGMC